MGHLWCDVPRATPKKRYFTAPYSAYFTSIWHQPSIESRNQWRPGRAAKFFHGDTATHPHCPQEARAGVFCVSGTGHLRMCLGNWYQLNIAVLIYLKPLDSYIILLITCVCCFRGPSPPPKTCEKSSTDERLLGEIWSAIRSTTCSIAVFLHFRVTKSQNQKLVKTFAGLPLDRLRDEFGG